MNGHSIEFVIEGGDYPVRARVYCDNAEGAWCREKCAEECDAWGDGAGCDHPGVDSGECNVLSWLNGDDPIGCYVGDDAEPHSGPIAVRWSSDFEGFEWEFAS